MGGKKGGKGGDIGEKTKTPAEERGKKFPDTGTSKSGRTHPDKPRGSRTEEEEKAPTTDGLPPAAPPAAPVTLRPTTPRVDPKPATPPPPGGAPRGNAAVTRRAQDSGDSGWEEWWRVNGVAWSDGGAFWPSPAASQTPDPLAFEAIDPAFVRATLGPRLAARLHDDDPQVASAALLALARVAGSQDGAMVAPLVLRALTDERRVMRDTALVALGLTGTDAARRTLAAIAADDREGRRLLQHSGPIDCTRRQLAALALGLSEGEESASALLSLAGGCDCEHITGAALLGAAHAAPGSAAVAAKLLATLDDAQSTDFVRAQAAVATGRLERGLGRAALRRLLDLAAAERTADAVRSAAVIALGALGRASDAELVAALERRCDSNGAPELRTFAFMALGRLLESSSGDPDSSAGADEVVGFLAERVASPRLSSDRPFAALALGIGVRDEAAGSERHRFACAALRDALANSRNVSTETALGLALGLARDGAAVNELLLRFEIDAGTASAPYWAEALGLAGRAVALHAKESLEERLADASSSPQLRRAAARALAQLGSSEALAQMVDHAAAASSDASGALAAEALGMFECRRSVSELLALLDAESTGRATRWHAVDSLARIGERFAPTWSAGYAIDSQYRLRTPALDYVLPE